MLEINNRYVRTDPAGDETIVIIKNDEELRYHSDLLSSGYKYTKVVVYDRKEECESCSS